MFLASDGGCVMNGCRRGERSKIRCCVVETRSILEKLCVCKEMRSGRQKTSGSVVAEKGLKALVAMVRGKPGDVCSSAGQGEK